MSRTRRPGGPRYPEDDRSRASDISARYRRFESGDDTERRDRYGSASATKANIERKRKALKHKRRMRFLRFLIFLFFATIFLAIAGFLCTVLYHWGSGIYAEVQVRHDAYLAKQAARAPELNPKFDGYTNVLVMGVDDGASMGDDGLDENGEPLKHADTILLLSVENDTGKLRILTIPRDTWVSVPGTGDENRIAALYETGGAPAVVRAAEQLLDVSIHQYVTVDMKTFAELVDVLGGVDLYVESNMDYDDPEADLSIHFEQGYQHLTGEQAVKYLRYRGTDLGDVGRAKRQQQFVRALYEQVMQVATVPKLPAIADILQTRVETSAEIFDSAHLANVLRHMNSAAPESWMVPGALAEGDDTIWVPDTQGIGEGIAKLFPPPDAASQETATSK